jgi:membrane-associated phospholipid phosphatase
LSAEAGGGVATAASSWLHQADANARATLNTLLRPPRRAVTTLDRGRLVRTGLIAAAAVLACMILFDPWSLTHMHGLPVHLIVALNQLTDLGRASFFLWPVGLALLALALMDRPAAPRFARLVLAAWAVRLGFLFIAIAVPGLFVAVIKRLIGRARPFVEGAGVWSYQPFNLRVEHASLPSGHAATAFAVVVAIGAMFPQARALMWIYAVFIGLSRIAIEVHHPSDVVAGAAIGAAGALLVRDWFAARQLGFTVGPEGGIHPLPGPSMRRIVKAIGDCLRSLRMTVA